MFGQRKSAFQHYKEQGFQSTEQRETCINRENHGHAPVQYFCLSESCLLDRLLCKKCVKQSHRRHKIGIIDKIVEPLNRLSMNSSNEEAQNIFNYLQSKIQLLCNQWQKIEEIFDNFKRELQKGILFQLTTIMNTFSSQEVDKAEEAMLRGDSKIEVINQYVTKINFLNKDYLQDTEKVKKYTEIITNRTKKTIKKAADTISCVLKKMQGHIREIDFNNCHLIEESSNSKPQANNEHQSDKFQLQQKNAQVNTDSEDERSKNSKRKDEQTQSSTQRLGSVADRNKVGYQKYTKNK